MTPALMLLALTGFYFVVNLLYYIPWLIATGRGHPSRTAIGLINWLLGWSIVGWFWALIWATKGPGPGTRVTVVTPGVASGTAQVLHSDDDKVANRSALINRIVVLAIISAVQSYSISTIVEVFKEHRAHTESEQDLSQAPQPQAPVTSSASVQQAGYQPQPASAPGVITPDDTSPAPSAQTTDSGFFHTSFNCEAASVDAERLICSNADLAAQDLVMAKLFADARDRVPDFSGLRTHARESLRFRDQYCHDVACVRDWYATQNHWYQDVLATASDPADK